MAVLATELRKQLEDMITQARDIAEAGAKAALESMAVSHHEPYEHMEPEERKLRNHLRARARQLGDRQDQSGRLTIIHLVWECAYEHWHRMLFARFLAENDLLIEPDAGVSISLEECKELAGEEKTDMWTFASRCAQQMLPQIFRPDDPLLNVRFAQEYRQKMEKLLADLDRQVFTAEDSLGWCYQFWQSKRKEEVNKSGDKIGADELPAVTQLFTEPYMVSFLIHNTLGAWHAAKVLDANPQIAAKAESEEELRRAVSLPGVNWEYLRFVREDEKWRPAAGAFPGWPGQADALKVLDPCCGSGHFLVALLRHLTPLRMTEESLCAREAVDAVLRDNLHGLEIDERCTQIAAFALALCAWTYPGAGGHRVLPPLKIACSGVAPNTSKKEWLELAGEDVALRNGMETLYDLFQNAPILGSLIDPSTALRDDLYEAGFSKVRPLLEKAIAGEKVETASCRFPPKDNYDRIEMSVAARGIAEAVELLGRKYHLVITNVPYLARGKQSSILREYIEKTCERAKNDLATVFLERCLDFCVAGGTSALVTPQNWLFLGSYQNMRKALLKEIEWNVIAKLGESGFQSPQAAGAFTVLVIISKINPKSVKHNLAGLDASSSRNAQEKATSLEKGEVILVSQRKQLENPDVRVMLNEGIGGKLLEKYAYSYEGLTTGDLDRFVRKIWEIQKNKNWIRYIQNAIKITYYSGRTDLIHWGEKGEIIAQFPGSFVKGKKAWGQTGLRVTQMRCLPATLYTGEVFGKNAATIIPHDPSHLPAIWCFCSSPQFNQEVRKIDQKLNVTVATLVKVPFDLEHWQKVAAEKYPDGLPDPYSEDPTQWLFKGTVVSSDAPLHVAIARLMGYRWPDQEPDALDKLADDDGIVCLPPVRGEEPAVERLRGLLQAAYGEEWSPAKEAELIAATGSKAVDLDAWLRDHFFEQHCKLFYHRPFIWHIWDGRQRDGFHALVNYHKLAESGGKGRQLLENLAYSYLGDWIGRQEDGVSRGEGGAEDRLAAAVELKKKLVAIIAGEPPFDIFVRWKPKARQSIGWEPDINDGVRLNIRPFMAEELPNGRKGAGILRFKPNINWSKDRGKEPERPREEYPWLWKDGKFAGNRVNDVHLTCEEKRRARGE